MSCDKESPAGTWINSNCRCSADMGTRFIIEAMQDWWITKTWEKEWNEKDLNMGYEHLVGDIELKYLVVKLETRIKNSKLLAKNFWIFLHPYLDPTPASLRPSPFFVGSVLLSIFCTQGLLTLVAGESHAHACFGPCCMSVFEVDDDEKWWMAFGQGTSLCEINNVNVILSRYNGCMTIMVL